MNRLTDKAAILFICIIACTMADSYTSPVISLLISLGASSAVQCFSGKKPAFFIIVLFSLSCLFVPQFFCSAPLMLYDALWEKKWWLTLPCVTAIFSLSVFQPAQFMLTAAGFLTALLLYSRTSRLEDALRKLNKVRDSAAEKTDILAQKNKRLAETQDYEIYLATLRERNRIAREIHDNVGHMLTRSILQVGALMIINKDDAQKEQLKSLNDTLNTAMTSIRSSVHNLHDDSIDLKQTVEECIKTLSGKFDVHCDYDISENVPKNIKLCIIGVVKESLSNIARHSKGDTVRITIREHPAFYQLAVEDNGSCGECGKIKENGIGLSNMRDRAASVNGLIRFTPSPSGFKVFLSAPKI